MKRALTAFLLLTTLLTTACGWHLRGTVDTSNLQSVHVSANNLQSNLVKELKRTLSNQGVAIEANAPAAQFSVVILAEKNDRRTASVGGSARAAEYLLSEQVDYLILGKAGQLLQPETTIRAERSFNFDENQVLSTADEEQIIRKELQQELVRQIIRRLQYLSPAQQATPAASE